MTNEELDERISGIAGDLYMLRTMRETLINRGRYPELVTALDSRIGLVDDKLAKLREFRTARDLAGRNIEVAFPNEGTRQRRRVRR